MQIENHKDEVPFAHYQRLFRSLDPGKAAACTGAKWDGKELYVNLLSREYAVSHPDYAIRALDGGAIPPLSVQTFLLRHLLEGKPAPWTGTWKTFREMPWGEIYHTPFSGRILRRAAFSFGSRTDAFRAACETIGGTAVKHGDVGFEFVLTGNYRMRILLWEGDEEFPPSAQILYSDNFAAGFTAEDRVVAAEILIGAVKDRMS